MDLTAFMAELRTDLKDSGSVWSDGELTRAINRAVDDLSRYMPLERIYEVTYTYDVDSESFTTPATADADGVVDSQTLNGKSAGDTLTLANPDVNVTTPRPVTLTITDADDSVTALTLIVKGVDMDGRYVEEYFNLVNGKTQTGKQIFKWFTEVEVNYIAGTPAASDVVDIGTSNAYDGWVELANRPIEPKTETVTSSPAGTTYARDTDYTIDYANGRIKFVNGGSMAAGTAYLISYDKSRLGIDISDILPVLTRVVRVEYPAYQVPQQFVSFGIWNSFMYVGSQKPNESQTRLAANDHIVIYYERKHTPPSLYSSGSYPDYLDEVVAIGAGGYALLVEALQYEQQAVTDFASARTAIGNISALHTLAQASLALADTQFDSAVVAGLFTKVDVALDAIPTAMALAATALTKVGTYLETNGTTDNAKEILADITDNAAELRTKIQTAQDAMATALGLVATNSLDKATTGAEAYLDTGDGNINAVNLGADVAGHYADYTRARVEIAQARVQQAIAYSQEAASRIDTLRTYIEEASGWIRMGETFMAESAQHIASASAYTNEANMRLQESDRWTQAGRAWTEQATTYLAEIDRYLQEANNYDGMAQANLDLADRFRVEATNRLNEFHSILEDKSQYRKRVASVPVVQPNSAGAARARTDRL